MRVIFSPDAKQEFTEAKLYYNCQHQRLGDDFHKEIISALSRIRVWPLSCPIERDTIRRLTLSRFPYKLLYSIEKDHIYVIAIAHQHRFPNYWMNRI